MCVWCAAWFRDRCSHLEEGTEITLLSSPSRSNRCRRKEPIRFAVRGFSPSQLVFGAWDALFGHGEGLERVEQRHSGPKRGKWGLLSAETWEMVGDKVEPELVLDHVISPRSHRLLEYQRNLGVRKRTW